MQERRRSPRHRIEANEEVGLPFSMAVRVLDISGGGVLLQASQPPDAGARGVLRLNLAGESFASDVAVIRISPVSTAPQAGYRIGAVFVSLSPEHRQVLERFMNQ